MIWLLILALPCCPITNQLVPNLKALLLQIHLINLQEDTHRLRLLKRNSLTWSNLPQRRPPLPPPVQLWQPNSILFHQSLFPVPLHHIHKGANVVSGDHASPPQKVASFNESASEATSVAGVYRPPGSKSPPSAKAPLAPTPLTSTAQPVSGALPIPQPRGPAAEAELTNQNFATRIRKRAIKALGHRPSIQLTSKMDLFLFYFLNKNEVLSTNGTVSIICRPICCIAAKDPKKPIPQVQKDDRTVRGADRALDPPGGRMVEMEGYHRQGQRQVPRRPQRALLNPPGHSSKGSSSDQHLKPPFLSTQSLCEQPAEPSLTSVQPQGDPPPGSPFPSTRSWSDPPPSHRSDRDAIRPIPHSDS